MANFLPNNTGRYRLVYRNITGVHRATLRCTDSIDAEIAARNTFEAIIGSLGQYLPISFVILACEYIAAHTNVVQPRPILDMEYTTNPNDLTGTAYAGQWRWEGRGINLHNGNLVASKVNFSWHGLVLAPPPTFRYVSTDIGPLNEVTEWLNSRIDNNEEVGLAVNGAKATWYEYTNYNYNSHFERKFRS